MPGWGANSGVDPQVALAAATREAARMFPGDQSMQATWLSNWKAGRGGYGGVQPSAGGASGSTPPASGGVAAAPVQARGPGGMSMPGGGGSPVMSAPMGGSTVAPAVYDNEFTGIRTDVPEQLLPANVPADAMNWNNIDRQGAMSKRRGMVMSSDTKRTINSAAYAAYYGGGLLHVPPTDMSEGAAAGGTEIVQLNSVFAFGSTGMTARRWLVRASPKWSGRMDMEDVDTLTLTATDAGSHILRVTLVDSGAANRNAIVKRTIRYSTVGFPVAWDGNDDYASTAISDQVAWTGAATGNLDTTLAAGATVYVTAWAHSREGLSAPVMRKVVVA